MGVAWVNDGRLGASFMFRRNSRREWRGDNLLEADHTRSIVPQQRRRPRTLQRISLFDVIVQDVTGWVPYQGE